MNSRSSHTYAAKGKFLLNSEYLVLDGASGVCLPLRLGQTLSIRPTQSENLIWRSLTENGELWFEAEYDPRYRIISTNDPDTAATLSALLKICTEQNPSFSPQGTEATTQLQFDRKWGLGSSSTLISLLGQWSGADPYAILDSGFGSGSGYDVAAATAERPFLFAIKGSGREVTQIDYSPDYSTNLFFVYSGRKQSSREGIIAYRDIPLQKRIQSAEKASQITRSILQSKTLSDFEQCLIDHERLLGDLLGRESLIQKYSDYNHGVVKSLGAWGGDFFLATGDMAQEYFTERGYDTIFKYDDIVCK